MCSGVLPTGAAAQDASEDAQIEKRITALLDTMTVEEKVGQMTQITLAVLFDEDSEGGKALDPQKLKEAIHTYHVGSILNTGSRALTLDQWHELIKAIQDEALSAKTPIPVIYGIDAIHGVTYTVGSTLFPHNIGLAASRNPDLVVQIADVTAMETRASGIRWNFDPVLDVGRNPLWSRFEETFGEDSYLAGVMGSAIISAYEKDDLSNIDAVASCMKHYVGYSDPANGKDRTPAYITDVELWEHHLPSFQAAVEAGASTIMINSASINGMPVHGSKRLLTDILRGRLGFEGLIVSDWEDVIRLHTRHKIAATPREAVRLAVEAGIDMSMVPKDYSFAEHLVSLVKDGDVLEERLDESVAIILKLKTQLGLFDNAYAEPEAARNFGRPEYKVLALEAARQSITLLKNTNDVLPLSENARVLLAGPAAHNRGALHGSWSYTWQGADESAYPDGTKSLADALVAEFGEKNISTMGEAEYHAATNVDTNALVRLADSADVIVLALGEPAYAESPGALDDLRLPELQSMLADAAIATGKPVVIVLLEGRPRVLGDIVDGAAAVVQAYRPGSQGGQAIADVLYGNHNPSGVLPYSYPQYTGDITPYDRRVLADIQQLTPGKVSRAGYKPEWPFGFGLSYTSFEISELKLDNDTLIGDGELTVSATITNTGDRDGDKVVDLFVSDLYASLSPAYQRLKGFKRVSLKSQQRTTVSFTLTKNDLSFINASLERVTEPGAFRVTVGDQATEFNYTESKTAGNNSGK
jgi:beta-glucosidase